MVLLNENFKYRNIKLRLEHRQKTDQKCLLIKVKQLPQNWSSFFKAVATGRVRGFHSTANFQTQTFLKRSIINAAFPCVLFASNLVLRDLKTLNFYFSPEGHYFYSTLPKYWYNFASKMMGKMMLRPCFSHLLPGLQLY